MTERATPETDARRVELEPLSSVWQIVEAMTDHARKLERQRDELIEGLRYLQISTAPDGQWADQAVKFFVDALLSRIRHSEG